MGDPFEPDTQQGPQISRSQVERIDGYVKKVRCQRPPCSPNNYQAYANVLKLMLEAAGCGMRHDVLLLQKLKEQYS